MQWRTVTTVSVVSVALACALYWFIRSYIGYLSVYGTGANSLILYNMFRAKTVLGDGLTSWTLVPAPYFIDMVLSWPLSIYAQTYQQFEIAVVTVFFFLLLIGNTLLFFTITRSRVESLFLGAIATAGFYALTPLEILLHVYMNNHTTSAIAAVFSLAGLVWCVRKVTNTIISASHLLQFVALAALVAFVNTLSDPYFIIMLVVPAIVAMAVAAPKDNLVWALRRISLVVLAFVAGCFAALWMLGWLGDAIWPHRTDPPGGSPVAAVRTFAALAVRGPYLAYFAVALALVLLALYITIKHLRDCRSVRSAESVRLVALMVVFITSWALCVAVPLAKDDFYSGYEYRYILFPAILTADILALFVWTGGFGFYRAYGRQHATYLTLRHGVLFGFIALGFIFDFMWPTPMSGTAQAGINEYNKCFRTIDRKYDLKDGLGGVFPARFVNAYRLSPMGARRNAIIFIWGGLNEVRVTPTYNSLDWIQKTASRRERRINFVILRGLGSGTISNIVRDVGEPSFVERCPLPPGRASPTPMADQIWIYTSDDAQKKLADLVVEAANRGVFALGRNRDEQILNPRFAMMTPPGDGELVGEHRIWHRRKDRPGGAVAVTKPFFLPSGRYRMQLTGKITGGSANSSPGTFTLTVGWESKTVPLQTTKSGVLAEITSDICNMGGATSGVSTQMSVHAGAAEKIEISSIKVRRLKKYRSDAFAIFRLSTKSTMKLRSGGC